TPIGIYMDARGTLRADHAAVRALIRKVEKLPGLTHKERRYLIQELVEHGLPKDEARMIARARCHLFIEQYLAYELDRHDALLDKKPKRDGRLRYSEPVFRAVARANGFQSPEALRQYLKRERQWLRQKKQP